ncbi:MAG TPA: adenylosuccinate synthase [Candidatus Krumholzibacteria bacterium]|nr:adenylosuccinate synthase [Candidatus Krumholzibacteria bacterium]HPD71165.1 adenylosuccinate synthase [Candidatus Krumholzibacteria bacterium]HRY39135.1 adenylosuccinate synthase [Candidatus Krumholzibacteria bacterium]
MENRVIIGGQWGDEGKGKVIDALGEGYDWVIRYQGGANAGHTIQVGAREHVLHLVPSGIFREAVRCYLGNGMVIDPWALRDEILALEEQGVRVRNRLHVSSAAQLLMPYHKRFDELREIQRKRKSIGTTGRGIGPAYQDKLARAGLRFGDLTAPLEKLERAAIEHILEANEVLAKTFDAEPLPAKVLAEELVVLAQSLRPLIVDGYSALRGVREGRESALFEGAQGTLLDIDHGTYPFVTSSNSTVGGALTGTGLPARCLGEVVGVFKAYCTRVGNGPFPTELRAEEGEQLRTLGREYGATTGRPRRCGWFDLVAGRYAVGVNGLVGLVITKLDVLDALPVVKVAEAYDLDGERRDDFPIRPDESCRVRPVLKELPGWEKPLGKCRRLADLPANARKYLEYLERSLGVLVVGISVGKSREQMVMTPTGVTA